MCRYAYATTVAIVAESMVGTDERVSFQEPHAQRDATVQAKIACRGHLPVGQPVEHKTLIKKLSSNRFLCHLMREGYGIPIRCECGPVRFGKSALPQRHGIFFQNILYRPALERLGRSCLAQLFKGIKITPSAATVILSHRP